MLIFSQIRDLSLIDGSAAFCTHNIYLIIIIRNELYHNIFFQISTRYIFQIFANKMFYSQVITQGGVTYRNDPWHRECFTCTHCQKSLAGQRFTSRDDKPYCADCFGELFSKRCTACSKPITGKAKSHSLKKWSLPQFDFYWYFSGNYLKSICTLEWLSLTDSVNTNMKK